MIAQIKRDLIFFLDLVQRMILLDVIMVKEIGKGEVLIVAQDLMMILVIRESMLHIRIQMILVVVITKGIVQVVEANLSSV